MAIKYTNTCISFILLNTNEILETIIANLIGGMIFYWIDKLIFKNIDTNEKI